MNAPGKSPSVRRVVVIAGAAAALASAMTPVSAASPLRPKPALTGKGHSPVTAKHRRGVAGGGSGLLSFQWAITSMLRP